MRNPKRSEVGSALIWTLCVIAILSAIAAELLQVMSAKYHGALHTATWQEALLAAESGVDLAVIELRKSLRPSPNNAWDGWTVTDSQGAPSPAPFARHGLTVVPNAGLSGTNMTVDVNVDAPVQLQDPSNLWQYYRVRATGTMPLVGPARAADNKQDTRLRKLSLRAERFAGTVFAPSSFNGPQVSRRVEAIVRPVSAFDQAVMSVGALNLNDADIIIDSYDSRDPSKSTNGLYDPAEAQSHGNIATDGNLINAGSAYVHGDVSTNAGTVTGSTHVTGVTRTDFYEKPESVSAPAWYQIYTPSPSVVQGSTTLAGGAQGTAGSRYILSAVSLSGSEVLNLAGNADGSTSYIELYVTGDISATGNAQIVVQPGVKATIYFAGNVKVAGNGLVNTSNQPGNLLLYGITPATTGASHTVELGGNGQLTAAVYAPDFDVQINNGGTRGTANGSFVGKTFTMTGDTDLHYDEALASLGRVANYKIVSWFEDNR